jgi:hypothetical protein
VAFGKEPNTGYLSVRNLIQVEKTISKPALSCIKDAEFYEDFKNIYFLEVHC